MSSFSPFANLVSGSFQSICKKDKVFVVDIDGDTLYAAYLAAFPEGTNPIYKKRTEHDCSCCRQFIRRVGTVVYVKGDELVTVWDDAAKDADYPYNIVAAALRDLVKAANIANVFLVGPSEGSFGNKKTHTMDEGKAVVWHHLYTDTIPSEFRSATADAKRGEVRTTVQVFERGLVELSQSAVDTVLSLIDENALYRGAEHKEAVQQFRKAQLAYHALHKGHNRFLWTNSHGPASRFRNTVIGTLVQDLSEGKPLEAAVGSFEAKVAPQNYKRTTALITPAMVKNAMQTIQELGLESALERRFAKIEDVSVNDVLWVDNTVKPLMKGGIGDLLMEHVANNTSTQVDEKDTEWITIDNFMKTVMPEVTSMDVLFTGNHLNNLVSLTAPVHTDVKQLFKWENDFAWSYGGNVTDSIKEKVKKAGGNVTNAKLRVSLSWHNYDDLDLHVIEPNGNRICFRNKCNKLDVDMNAGSGTSRTPVENVSFVAVPDGIYAVIVHQFRQRETVDGGFTIEVENDGKLSHFTYPKVVAQGLEVQVLTLTMKGGKIADVRVGDKSIATTAVSQEKWGLTTETFVKVKAVMYSPNYWHGKAVGNKHTVFILEGAENDEPTRGIYNEFLHPRLETHRKVFEVIGEKTKCQPTEGQLSGLGFSSTKTDSVIVRTRQGKKQRLYNVIIGA